MGKRALTAAEKAAREKLKREVGERLRLVRQVLDLGQGEFARRAKLEPNTYNQIENGEKMPSIETAIALCEAHRITLDWISRAEPGDMNVRLFDGIRALQAARHDN